MNKVELVSAIAEQACITKKDAEAALEAFKTTVVESVAKGEKVQILGFGSFESVKRSGRKGVNPFNGKAYKTSDTVVPKFRAGQAFKDAVANKKPKKSKKAKK